VAGAIDGLLRRCGLGVRDLAGIAVGIGPGSFTGLRIALSYAKGVAMATGCAIAGVPSLDALAMCAMELPGVALQVTICPILDARKQEVYAALYRRVENKLEKLSGEFLAKPGELVRLIEGPVIFVGDGAQRYRDVLRSGDSLGEGSIEGAGPVDGAGNDRAMVASFSAAPPAAAMIAAAGAARIAQGQADLLSSLQPLYVRPSEAELKAKRPANTAGLEALWSTEKKSSSAST
jgi:tRNA threonylcarbamoyladenosine biosynthesis protein TsaB